MKRLPVVFIAMLLLTLFLVGCSNVPAPPPAVPSDQAAVDAAVAATLTAIAQADSEERGSTPSPSSDATTAPSSLSTPGAPAEGASSQLILPASVPDFAPAVRPASSKGNTDAPVVIFEWSDYT